jgi:conjugative transfer region protein TrbK
MMTDRFNRIPIGVAALLLTVAVGACAIQLRGGDDQAAAPASAIQETDPLASKLAQCRSVNYEQKEELLECRKIWAETRRQFLSQRKGATPQVGDGASANGSIPSSVKDESRLPSGYLPVPKPGGNEQ